MWVLSIQEQIHLKTLRRKGSINKVRKVSHGTALPQLLRNCITQIYLFRRRHHCFNAKKSQKNFALIRQT
jgi:hypothetical protein